MLCSKFDNIPGQYFIVTTTADVFKRVPSYTKMQYLKAINIYKHIETFKCRRGLASNVYNRRHMIYTYVLNPRNQTDFIYANVKEDICNNGLNKELKVTPKMIQLHQHFT